MAQISDGRRMFVCRFCTRPYTRRDRLHRHLRTVHPDEVETEKIKQNKINDGEVAVKKARIEPEKIEQNKINDGEVAAKEVRIKPQQSTQPTASTQENTSSQVTNTFTTCDICARKFKTIPNRIFHMVLKHKLWNNPGITGIWQKRRKELIQIYQQDDTEMDANQTLSNVRDEIIKKIYGKCNQSFTYNVRTEIVFQKSIMNDKGELGKTRAIVSIQKGIQ